MKNRLKVLCTERKWNPPDGIRANTHLLPNDNPFRILPHDQCAF
jgi:hypothetical protein